MLNTKLVSAVLLVLVLLMYFGGWWVSREPAMLIDEIEYSHQHLGDKAIVGYSTTTALIRVSETLLDKSGGYLANDVYFFA